MKAKLTRRTVEAFKATGRDELVWDDEVAGFGLKVTRTGTKTYLLQYRLGGRGSPTRRYTIGKHGSPWSVEAARDEAKRLLRLVAEGRDPAREREQAIEVTVAATSRTFRKVAEEFRDRYLKRHSPKHWPETWRTLE
ncbi:MAG TPA: Arm DNA-binding domain-containing protein, partial [Azospirillaceae bacterium]|nr:Arm DNA-binding domain-containing protein [Azospirillaceae bacterium]